MRASPECVEAAEPRCRDQPARERHRIQHADASVSSLPRCGQASQVFSGPAKALPGYVAANDQYGEGVRAGPQGTVRVPAGTGPGPGGPVVEAARRVETRLR